MEKFKKFKKFMVLYRTALLIEIQFRNLGIELNPEMGIQLLIDELISWVPDLILNNPEAFWNKIDYSNLSNSEDVFDSYVEELWEDINQ
jgi:hypothetical protein